MTLNAAKLLIYGQVIFHRTFKNADGTPQRWRVTGRVKKWKKSPDRVSVPIKSGLYLYGHVTENNLDSFDVGPGAITNYGCRPSEESALDWIVIKGRWLKEPAIDICDRAGFNVHHEYHGPGRMFRNPPVVKVKGSRTLVISRSGLDI